MKGVLPAVEEKEYLSDNLSWVLSADEKTSALRELVRKRKVLFRAQVWITLYPPTSFKEAAKSPTSVTEIVDLTPDFSL